MAIRPRSLAYAALVATTVTLLADAVLTPHRAVATGAIVVLAAPAAGTAARELRALREEGTLPLGRSDAVRFLAVTAGAALTRLLAVDAGLGPVVASSLVGVVAGLALSKADGAAYCGSFVGMASSAAVPEFGWVVAAGAVAGGVYVAAHGVFDGFGGKLGTTALSGCLAVVALGHGGPVPAAGLPWELAVAAVPVGVVAAVMAAAIGYRFGAGAVLGSASVGLVAGVGFPLLFGASTALPAVAFAASFAGMAAPNRLGGWGGYAAAGAVTAVVFLAVAPALAGMGGKLGTTAFLSCLAVASGRQVVSAVWSDRIGIAVNIAGPAGSEEG